MGEPLLEYAIEKADDLTPDRLAVVIGHGKDQILDDFSDRNYAENSQICWAIQEEQLGTAHAAKVGIDALFPDGREDGYKKAEEVLIINADLPLLRSMTLQRMIEAHAEANADVTVLTCIKDDPSGFGRIVRGKDGGDSDGRLIEIIEENDADEDSRTICEVNVGAYLLKPDVFFKYYESIGSENQQGERYLTDVVVEAARAGAKVETVAMEEEVETAQVNCQKELAAVQAIMKDRLIEEHLEAGVQIDDPSSTYIEKGAKIAPGAQIHPFCVIRRATEIGPGCKVGPFSHLRPGTLLQAGAKVGNFVETKNSRLGSGSKTSHLSYIGDGDVGERVNIGAGTIFANYDGKNKNKIQIEDDAFIGSGTILVAPVTIGKEARTGAGAVVLRGRDVPDGETVVGVPARQLAAGKKGGGKTQG